MENNKYLNHYVDVLTSTVTDVVLKNLSMQANAKITEEVLKEQQDRITELSILCANQEQTADQDIVNLNLQIQSQNETIDAQTSEIQRLKHFETHFENVKYQLDHLETTRNELAGAREAHRVDVENHKSELETLRANHHLELETLRANHHLELETLRNNYQAQINNLISEREKLLRDQESQLQSVHDDYQKQVNEIVGNFESQITELNGKIEYLQLPAAKRKKIDAQNNVDQIVVDIKNKDGGSF